MIDAEKSLSLGEWPRENEFRELFRNILDDPMVGEGHRPPPEKECLAIIDDRVVDFLTKALEETPLEEAQATLLKTLQIIREFLGERLAITRFADRRTEQLAFEENDVPLSGGARQTPKYRAEVEKRVDAEAYIGRLKSLLILRILGARNVKKPAEGDRRDTIDEARRAVQGQLGVQVGKPKESISLSLSERSTEDSKRQRETILGNVHVKYALDPARPTEFIVLVGTRQKGATGLIGGAYSGFKFKSAPAAVEGFNRICEVVGTFMETKVDVSGNDHELLKKISKRIAALRSEAD